MNKVTRRCMVPPALTLLVGMAITSAAHAVGPNDRHSGASTDQSAQTETQEQPKGIEIDATSPPGTRDNCNDGRDDRGLVEELIDWMTNAPTERCIPPTRPVDPKKD